MILAALVQKERALGIAAERLHQAAVTRIAEAYTDFGTLVDIVESIGPKRLLYGEPACADLIRIKEHVISGLAAADVILHDDLTTKGNIIGIVDEHAATLRTRGVAGNRAAFNGTFSAVDIDAAALRARDVVLNGAALDTGILPIEEDARTIFGIVGADDRVVIHGHLETGIRLGNIFDVTARDVNTAAAVRSIVTLNLDAIEPGGGKNSVHIDGRTAVGAVAGNRDIGKRELGVAAHGDRARGCPRQKTAALNRRTLGATVRCVSAVGEVLVAGDS